MDLRTSKKLNGPQERNDTLSHKLLILFLDKGVLALVAATLGFVSSMYLQRTEGIIDYQKALFTERKTAYEQIVWEAQKAHDFLMSVYAGKKYDASLKANEQFSSGKLQIIYMELVNLRTGWSGGAGGEAWGGPNIDEALKATSSLIEIDRIRNKYAMVVSSDVDDAISIYLRNSCDDLESFLNKVKSESANDEAWKARVQTNTEAAYKDLLKAIRKSIKIDAVVAG